jgi:hypothetical protein
MITVASYDNIEQAELLRIRLEERGVSAYVSDSAVVALNWMYSNAVGGVKVQVDEADIDKVRSLLTEWEEPDIEQALLSEYHCPFCGSSKVESRKISRTFFMLSLLLLGVPLALYRPEHHCLECCKTWKKK